MVSFERNARENNSQDALENMANADKTHNALNDATPGGDDDTNDKLTSIAVKREKKSNDAANDGTTQKTPGQTKRTNTEARKARAKRKAFKGELYDMISKLLVVGAIYCTLLFAIGKDHMLPHSAGWATFLLWLAAQVGGLLAIKCKLPSLLGMLLAGLLLKNIPGDPVQGLPSSWSTVIREAGLGIILMRSGLELDYDKVREAGAVAARLTLLPGITEALAVALIGMAIFGMPIFMGLSMGFILAAVSPAVVVIGMFDLQRSGYGVAKGIPSLVVAAASFDDVVALSGFSLFSGLAIPHGSLLMSILSGPIQIIGGVLSGVLCGCLCACTRLWNSRVKRTLFVLFMGMTIMFVWAKFHYTTAGAMGCLIMGITAGMLWQRGWPGRSLSLGPNKQYAHEVEEDLAYVWSMAAQPLLFSVIGSAVNFRIVKAEVIPLSILVTLFGVLFRLPAACMAVGGAGLTMKERVFVALSWIPKATVQAALGSVPLDYVETYKKDDKQYKDWAEAILTTAVFSIILTAPIGLLVINKLGPRWLSKDVDENGQPLTPELATDLDEDGKVGGEPSSDQLGGRRSLDRDSVGTGSALSSLNASFTKKTDRRPSLQLGVDILKKAQREMGAWLADGDEGDESLYDADSFSTGAQTPSII